MAELSYIQMTKQNVIVRKFSLPFLVEFVTYISRQECCAGTVECLRAVRSQEDLSGSFRKKL